MVKDAGGLQAPGRKRTPVADTLFAFFAVVLATGVFWLIKTPPYVPHSAAIARSAPMAPDRVPIGGAATLGAESAPVALVEFSDFQCPFCATFARDFLPTLQRKYVQPGLLRLVFMHLPLLNLHRDAFAAAAAAQCAGPRGRFWQLHQVLFLRQSDIGLLGVRRLAADAGVATDAAFDNCLSDPMTRAAIADHTAIAYDLGITVTPSFLLGRVTDRSSVSVAQRFSGIQSFQDLDKAIAAMVAAAGSANEEDEKK